MTRATSYTGVTRMLELFDDSALRSVSRTTDGYSDVLDALPPAASTYAQRLMRTRGYASVYQLGRPLGRRIAGGAPRMGRDADRRSIGSMMALRPGATVLDIGCGPGNFAGWFGREVGAEGLVVGVDASTQMLRRAVLDNWRDNVAYLRADAGALPFVDGCADAVCCLAALYLINEPRAAVTEMARVLAPGGRLVILTSVSPAVPGVGAAIAKFGGVTMFGRREVVDWLSELGFVDVGQTVGGLAQTIVATKGDPHE